MFSTFYDGATQNADIHVLGRLKFTKINSESGSAPDPASL